MVDVERFKCKTVNLKNGTVKYYHLDPELKTFIENFTPTEWTEPIKACCFVPFCWDYYKETGIPWYIQEACKTFKKMKGLPYV